uniref:Uncharacterized protein n=1 Tax=Anguilla anguilla TaxID=7936 RepID=A0A0E9XV11_ANGAN
MVSENWEIMVSRIRPKKQRK